MPQINLTKHQAKFYELIVNEAMKDDELFAFLTARATGKTFAMNAVIEALRSMNNKNKSTENEKSKNHN